MCRTGSSQEAKRCDEEFANRATPRLIHSVCSLLWLPPISRRSFLLERLKRGIKSSSQIGRGDSVTGRMWLCPGIRGRFEARLYQSMVGSGLVCIRGNCLNMLGFVLRKTASQLCWVLILAGAFSIVGLAPSTFIDRSEVDDESVSIRTGLWGWTAVSGVRFQDLRAVRLTTETTVGR